MSAKDEKVRALFWHLWNLQGGYCAVCGENLRATGARPQIAHRLPQNQVNLRKYGEAVIHHELNTRLVCSLECNQKVSRRNYPLWEARHVAKIRKALKEET